MSGAFHYRPKYVDIRVVKPAPEPQRGPEERACDHTGCARGGAHPAPKAPNRSNEFWWFCREHAGEYNRRWNYFEGMTEDDFVNHQGRETAGHRPTFNFRPGRHERLSATRFWRAAGPGDGFGLFRRHAAGGPGAAAAPPRLSKIQVKALEALDLPETADGRAIRGRYAELVRRYHPDSNGGDRSTEQLLERTVKAYQVLKSGGKV
jgi:DnaJ domain